MDLPDPRIKPGSPAFRRILYQLRDTQLPATVCGNTTRGKCCTGKLVWCPRIHWGLPQSPGSRSRGQRQQRSPGPTGSQERGWDGCFLPDAEASPARPGCAPSSLQTERLILLCSPPCLQGFAQQPWGAGAARVPIAEAFSHNILLLCVSKGCSNKSSQTVN